MSSTYLMKEIRAIAPSDNYYEQMNQVTNYLQRKPATIEQVKILPRDVLRQAICNTHDNIKYPSNYGVGGDYMALKRFLSERGQDFDDESDFVKERNKYSPCEATIYETFKIILKNLFEVDNVNYNAPNKNFNYQFYKDLNMLLIDFNLKNVIYDPTSPKPIDKEYFKEIGENIMSQINTQLTMEHIEPNIILFNFDYTPNLKVHDVTFVDLRKHIRSAIKDDLLNPRPNLKIILSRQLFTIPKITGNIFTYPFPISRKIVQYRLKGISFILEEEIETNLSDFPNVKGPSADLKECMDQLKARTLKDIKDTYEKVMTSLFFDKNSGLFAGLCLEITDPLDVYGNIYGITPLDQVLLKRPSNKDDEVHFWFMKIPYLYHAKDGL
ncbi:hypothetical protein SNEBB_009962 [Seison nebaliae]|nr:hypothetical protein SNEBB_009962 [Seison nebaliae]